MLAEEIDKKTIENGKGTGPNKSRRFTRVHSTFYSFIQQEEI